MVLSETNGKYPDKSLTSAQTKNMVKWSSVCAISYDTTLQLLYVNAAACMYNMYCIKRFSQYSVFKVSSSER